LSERPGRHWASRTWPGSEPEEVAMQRPRVVVSIGASADGKVALTREQILMGTGSGARFTAMWPPAADPVPFDLIDAVRQLYGCNATLEGSGSLVDNHAAPDPLPIHEGDSAPLYSHFLPPEKLALRSPPHMWFTAVDGRGRVRWTEDHENWDILVLVCGSTPPDYLAYLRRRNISYLVAGDERVDLRQAITAMGTELGISCVLSTAGGGLQGALLRAGLIDELHLSIAPSLVGGLGTPTIMDGRPLQIDEPPTPLRLLSVHTDAAGIVRLHYEVVRES
jgi:2,5-diamino-6-(ribosylamino)-4(3H)-pyrimidinone 5'-phosphate reductase